MKTNFQEKTESRGFKVLAEPNGYAFFRKRNFAVRNFAILVCFACSLGLLFATGCQQTYTLGASGNPNQLNVVVTTGQINSALLKITEGTDAKIKLFCGPGVDPHSFSASSNDIKAMEEADAIFYNGFHLEAKLHELLHHHYEDKSWSMASAFPKESRLDWVEDGEVDPNAPFDPHIWNHLPAWSQCVQGLADQLAKIDPDNAQKYLANAKDYVAEIQEAHQWAQEQLKTIPKERRFLVSAHDAFNYFAKEYGLETVAVLGVGNDAEADIRTMQQVSKTICERKVPVIFMESITNPKITTALKESCESKGWKVEIASQQLYSDDLGESAPQNSFLGAFRSNVEVITSSLSQ